MNEMIHCQSCGMPLTKNEEYGTNADGGKNEDYCVHCYKDGAFTGNMTMDEMIAFCSQYSAEMKMTKEESIAMMKEFFPTLKRWKQA